MSHAGRAASPTTDNALDVPLLQRPANNLGKQVHEHEAADADRRSLADIADEPAEFRMRAFRATFSEQHLRDATITVSWNHDQEVVAVRPIVLPETACSVSVGGPLDEVRADADGQLPVGRVTNVGLAHDHGIVNGRDAIAFLDAGFATALQDSAILADLAKS